MKSDAFSNDRTKFNFLRNSFENAFKTSNNNNALRSSLDHLSNMFTNNGFPPDKISKALQSAIGRFNNNTKSDKNKFANDISNKTLFKNAFIINGFGKTVENIATKHGLDVKAVEGRAAHIADIAKPKDSQNKVECTNSNCLICDKLTEKFNCNMTSIIYQFTCTLCGAYYIGKTDTTLSVRFYQHRMALNRNDVKSPLVRHFREHHTSAKNDMSLWKLEVLSNKPHEPLDTALTEARYIVKHKPTINRKKECRTLIDL